MIYFDSETCGLVGPMVLLQYAEDRGPIRLHEIWNEPISKSLEVIEYIVNHPGGVCAFNLAFDWFHLTKIYNILRIFKDSGYTGVPTIESMIKVEAANPSEYCLRPQSALDLLLYARKGPYQSTMDRKDITIRRVPAIISEIVCEELKKAIPIDDIYFARSSKGYEWRIEPVEGTNELVNIKLKFAASAKLAAIAHIVLGEDKADWPIPKDMMPTERSWLPYGQYGSKPWGMVIARHISMWQLNPKARYYAEKDVDIVRKLHDAWGKPETGDVDSELAWAVGAARWRGFSIDPRKAEELKATYIDTAKAFPKAPKPCLHLLHSTMSDDEKKFVKGTSKKVLETLLQWEGHPVVPVATGILAARKATKRIELLDKFIQLESYHPDFKVIGTRSNRMAGGSEDKGTSKGAINPQGIPKEKVFRELFPFAYPGERLTGGDADSYEITIMDAYFDCPNLRRDLLSGKKFHGLMGAIWLEKFSYEEIVGNAEVYGRVKNADFAWSYGAFEAKIAETLGIAEESITAANQRLKDKYPEIAKSRMDVAMRFCSMRQPNGIGSKVEWHEPDEYIENLFGFKRYFTLENMIVKALFEMGQHPPRSLKGYPGHVTRRAERGQQTITGALQTAVLAAAFGVQAANMRAACNHVIQSTGGEITKAFQWRLSSEQPKGIHPWVIRVINIHDELMAVDNGKVDVFSIRDEVIEKYRKHIPLLGWGWKTLRTWGDK